MTTFNQAPDRSASEATSLLDQRPSKEAKKEDSSASRAYSGDMLPLTSSYEDLRQSVEMQLKELNPASMRKVDSVVPSGSIMTRRQAVCILIFGCMCLLGGYLISCMQSKPKMENGGNNRLQSGVDPTPFSFLDPVQDLNLPPFQRGEATAPPKELFATNPSRESMHAHSPKPTNAWYQNLLLLRGEPSNVHRVYSSPHLLDVTGGVPGLRTHSTRILASTDILQLTVNEQFGLTLGAGKDFAWKHSSSNDLSHAYTVNQTTNLGLTLKWDAFNMEATIVKGMPYTTMEYFSRSTRQKDEVILPTIASPINLAKAPIIDGDGKLDCSLEGKSAFVDHELELQFIESDFKWLIFFSQPVWIQCKSWAGTTIQILEPQEDGHLDSEMPLVVRAALLTSCSSSGMVGNTCRKGLGDRLSEEDSVEQFANVLRKYSCFYPGRNNNVTLDIQDDAGHGNLVIDWDVQSMCSNRYQAVENVEKEIGKGSLLMFALPHHMDRFGSSMNPDGLRYCKSSLNGRTCLVQGSKWTLQENLPRIGLQAPRLPLPGYVPALSKALEDDMKYRLPNFFERGAGDTYFSGKMLSKLARILLIAEELTLICAGKADVGNLDEEYDFACNNITLPSPSQQQHALDRLRSSTEVWINGSAEAPFVYDEAWGGVVNCGCNFDEGHGGRCKNKFPDCPAFSDQGLNFGNGFYNDHHFHYGYHIHAAAVVSHFDSQWGKSHFEKVLLLIRNIANPSIGDTSFPLYRHKDWYQGSSWASGVPLPPYLNGKNQESSSEAIAAYESIALYGQVMKKVWQDPADLDKKGTSTKVMKIGQMMAATEIRSAQKYWHIKRNNHEDEDVVPRIYTQNVVGILWSTMAQFGTWFGTAPYLPYGIQLLPLTPISEERDEIEWVNEMYYPFSRGCADFHQCTESGWAVLQLGILATVGYPEHAAARVKELLPESFENAGGNGQSKSNTIWYIATRPNVTDPVEMDASDIRGHEELRPAPVFVLSDCHSPKTCTSKVLDNKAGKYSCRERIDWVIHVLGSSQWEACTVIATDYADECGACSPGGRADRGGEPEPSASIPEKEHKSGCPQCSLEQCESDLNRCPAFERSFVCTAGPSRGGCSGDPWILSHEHCHSCCEMTLCQKLKDEEAKKITKDGNPLSPPKCPPCEPSICYGKMNQCPLHTAPYICLGGFSIGGCSATPWDIDSKSGQCTKCCEITISC